MSRGCTHYPARERAADTTRIEELRITVKEAAIDLKQVEAKNTTAYRPPEDFSARETSAGLQVSLAENMIAKTRIELKDPEIGKERKDTLQEKMKDWEGRLAKSLDEREGSGTRRRVEQRRDAKAAKELADAKEFAESAAEVLKMAEQEQARKLRTDPCAIAALEQGRIREEQRASEYAEWQAQNRAHNQDSLPARYLSRASVTRCPRCGGDFASRATLGAHLARRVPCIPP